MKCYVTAVEVKEVELPSKLFEEDITDDNIFNAAAIAFMNSDTTIESYIDCIEDEERNTLCER